METYRCPVWRSCDFCFSLRFIVLPLVVSGAAEYSIRFITGAVAGSVVVALKLRSCSCTELYLVTRVLAYFLRRFWAECTVSSSSIARSRLFAHVFAHSVHLRSSSALSFFERSFRTFLYNFISSSATSSDSCDYDSGHLSCVHPYLPIVDSWHTK